MKVIGQSVVKANNDVFENGNERENEDAWANKSKVVAISDGAGGVGILADKWAQLLVNNIPNTPFKSVNSIDTWISEFWEAFYTEYSKFLSNDPWQIKKFEDEGSLATLSALWEIEKDKYMYQSYGDSALFIFNNKTGNLEIQDNIKSINFFGTSPHLINWKTEEHSVEGFYEQKINLKDNEEIIMATDGIAMYIFGAYMVFNNSITEDVIETKMAKIVDFFKENPIKDFKVFLLELKKSLDSKSNFKNLTHKLNQNNFLVNDDYTLVWIEKERKNSQLTKKKKRSKSIQYFLKKYPNLSSRKILKKTRRLCF